MNIENHKFTKIFEYATSHIFNGREQFGEAIASTLYQHRYIYCIEEEVFTYIQNMLKYADIDFKVKNYKNKKWTEHKIILL